MRHADPRTLEHRFTIGRAFALAGRAGVACRWPLVLVAVPTAIADVGIHWFVFSHFGEQLSAGWRQMASIWLGVPLECIALVSITFAAVGYMRGQGTSARDVLRIPWRRVPSVLVAGLILQSVTFWPMPLLAWRDDPDHGIVLDYAILTINVLAADVLSFVWLPVLLMENRSLVETFRRSVQFALRHPWRFLAIDIALWLVYFAIKEASSVVYAMIDPRWGYLAWSAISAVWIMLMMSISCCVIAAAYHLVRGEHEGPAPEALARVFE